MSSRVLVRLAPLTLLCLVLSVVGPGPLAPLLARSAEPDAVAALLSSGDPVKRTEGLDALEKAGKSDASEKLALHALADPDWGVAIRAAKALVVLGGPASVEPLAKVAIEGEVAWLRSAAIAAAKVVGAEAAAGKALYVISVAKDDAVKVRALEALASWAGASHLKRLRPLARDKDALVEAAAVAALGSLASDLAVREDVFEVLGRVLLARNDKDRFLAYAAALDALGALDLPRAREMLATEVAVMEGDDDYAPARVARMLAATPPAQRDLALAAAWPKAKDAVALAPPGPARGPSRGSELPRPPGPAPRAQGRARPLRGRRRARPPPRPRRRPGARARAR